MYRYTNFGFDNEPLKHSIDSSSCEVDVELNMGGDYGVVTEEELQNNGSPYFLRQKLRSLSPLADSKLKQLPSRLRLSMENLRCRQIAPTAPDTLPCYPFPDVDPFIISKCPSVLFAGNQPKFESCTLLGSEGQRTQIICVPDFSKTGEVVLVDVNNDMKTTVIRIHSKVLSSSAITSAKGKNDEDCM